MNARPISDRVQWLGAVDWDRRLFDALIPLPDGTSYNAYLVRGSEGTVLFDTVDPTMTQVLMEHLDGVPAVDYLVVHHVEQDHSGAIPAVLARYPKAKLVCTPVASGMFADHLGVDQGRVVTVADGETLSLGDRTLRFIHTPWVHWPETMVTLLEEERILFSCDFFGSHLATSDLYADWARVHGPAKRYYAEIMMPFRKTIVKNLEKVRACEPKVICPSHGPVYGEPEPIIAAYEDWAGGEPRNMVVLPYVSMHGSTKQMVEHLVAALVKRGVGVEQIDLPGVDLGKLAMALVDAATVVIGTPTVIVGPHPLAAQAAYLAAALKPKFRWASVIGSYGWGTKAAEQIAGALAGLKPEVLEPVICKGLPRADDLAALDRLADAIAERHKGLREA
jgi:flavorubredoxin